MNHSATSPSPLAPLQGLAGWLVGTAGPVLALVGIFLLLKKAPRIADPLMMGVLLVSLAAQVWTMVHLGHWFRDHGPMAWGAAALWAGFALLTYIKAPAPELNALSLALMWIGFGLGMFLAPTGLLSERFRSLESRPFAFGLLAGLVLLGLSSGLSAVLPQASQATLPIWSQAFTSAISGVLLAMLSVRICHRSWPALALVGFAILIISAAPLFQRSAMVTIPAHGLGWAWILGLAVGAGLSSVIPELSAKPA